MCLGLHAATRAAAQEAREESAPRVEVEGVEVELLFFGRRIVTYDDWLLGFAVDSAFLVSTRMRARAEVDGRWAVGLEWGTATLWSSSSPANGFLGNPFVDARRRWTRGAWRFELGGGLGLPLSAGAWRASDARSAEAMALAARGLVDAWLWLDDALSLVGRGGVEMRDVRETRLRWGFELAYGECFDVQKERGSPFARHYAWQLRGEIGFAGESFEGGLSLQGASLDGATQWSALLYGRARIRDGYIGLSLLTNLGRARLAGALEEPPYKVGFARDGVYGLTVSGGLGFD